MTDLEILGELKRMYYWLEDILEIPAYIHSIVPEYKFYIRHYSFSTSETVLYATIADDIV